MRRGQGRGEGQVVMNVLLFTAQLSAGAAGGGSCDSGSLVRKAHRMASRSQLCGARAGEGTHAFLDTSIGTSPRRACFLFFSFLMRL